METAGVVRRTPTAVSGMSPAVLEPFPHQVAGQSLVFRYDANTICKSLISRELRVYQTLPDGLKPYVPQYRGVVDIALTSPSAAKKEEEGEEEEEEDEEEKSRKEQEGEGQSKSGGVRHPLTTQRLLDKVSKRQGHNNVYHFLLLENIVSGFQRPCVLDLKLGTRQHGDDAPSHKVRYQVHKCRSTTSALLGVRLCGMKVYQSATGKHVNVDKVKGRNMREDDFREAMRHFLFNGRHIRRDLIPVLLAKLQALKAAISDLSSFRFYSSSLLIVYDGWEPRCQCKNGTLLEKCSPLSTNDAREHETRNYLCCTVHEQHKNDSFAGVNKRDGLKTQTVANVDPNLPGGLCAACHHFPARGSQVPQRNCLSPQQDQRKEKHCVDCDGPCIRQAQGDWNGQSVTAPPSSSTPNLHTDIGQASVRDRAQSSEGNGSPRPNRYSDSSVVGNPGESALISAKTNRRWCSNGELPTGENKADQNTVPDTGRETDSLSRGLVPCDGCSRLVDVRMVDFAHTTHAGLGEDVVVYQGPDQGCLLGLSTLIDVFTGIDNDTAHQEL